ncbi:hypothetical protein ACN47E_002673 [Coniothyrium glycines]
MRAQVVFAAVAIVTNAVVTGRALNDSSPYQPSHSPGHAPESDDNLRVKIPGISIPTIGGLDFDPKVYASDAIWQRHVEKGNHLICLMQATDKGAGYLTMDNKKPPSAASRWTGDMQKDLDRWFWHNAIWDEGWECDWERQGLKTVFDALGLNAKPAFEDDGTPLDGHNDCLAIQHYDQEDVDEDDEWGQMKPVTEQKYKVDGKEYMATGAFYLFAMNKIDGAIIAKNIQSPSVAVLESHNWGRAAAPGELPDLRFCSDIYWAYWTHNNPNVRKLKVYGAHHVINDETMLLATRAMKNKQVSKLSEWPGVSFSAEEDEGKALIGSPLGATIAHMLVAHKAELGIKHITKITIVTDTPKKARFGEKWIADMHIFFEIADMPADRIPKDEPDEKLSPRVVGGLEGSRTLRIHSRGRHILRVHKMSV